MSSLSPSAAEDHTALALRTGKWSISAVVELRQGTRRFSELKRALAGISQKTLTATLRDLERDGLVSRTIFATIPPRVDYALTGLGQELLEIIDLYQAFALRNRMAMATARAQFDRVSAVRPRPMG